MYYCFNTECNLWGEPQNMVVPLTMPGVIKNRCKGCAGDLISHDNWASDQRTHDDGTPVKET